MKKRLLKTAIATALTVAFAVPVFAAPVAANPFTDVPAKHWAYDAVNKLAQAGIVDGYGDGTFRGDKTMTRYEMATIVAKAMTKSLNADQKAVTDKLAKEFGTELNSLGVKVAGLEKKVDNMVQFSGNARARYYNADVDGGAVGDKTEYRFRIGATAKVNENTSLYARITSGSQNIEAGNGSATIENAFAATKLMGVDTKIGRQDYELGQGTLAGAGSVAILNGVSFKAGNFKAFAGKELKDATNYATAYGAQYDARIGLPVTASYLNIDEKDYYAVATGFNLVPGLKISGEFAKNDTDNAQAYTVKAGLGKTGLSVAYKDIERNAVPFEGDNNLKSSGVAGLQDFYALSTSRDVKGMEYEYNKTLAKNTNLNVLYQDIKDYGKNVRATVSTKF